MKRLYYGDNLDVLRESIADESVDLIYLDPPFNSSANYNILFKSPTGEQSEAQITAFEDSWQWGSDSERLLEQMKFRRGDLALFLDFFVDSLGKNALSAYLVMMAARLVELYRVLKPTGSLYLHCDPTASHYLKVILDRIFGAENFRNEIIWHYKTFHGQISRYFAKKHDTIFWFSKGDNFTYNQQFDTDFLSTVDSKRWAKYFNDRHQITADNMPIQDSRFMRYLKKWIKKHGRTPEDDDVIFEAKGQPIDSVWHMKGLDPKSKERLGYPTQKPEALLERIIQASSNPGDVVLDPFCGCGTAVHAAEKLGRNWIGIDITHLAIALIEKRLRDAFSGIEFEVEGTPKDLEGAKDLAKRDKYQFQWWACSLVNAQPYGGKKKGADGGIDGQIFFTDFAGGKTAIKQIIVSVKGGANVSLTMLKDLIATVHHNKAEIGLFVTLTPPTRPMVREASLAGFYRAGNRPVGK